MAAYVPITDASTYIEKIYECHAGIDCGDSGYILNDNHMCVDFRYGTYKLTAGTNAFIPQPTTYDTAACGTGDYDQLIITTMVCLHIER